MKLSNQRAQYLAESALVFSLVVAALIAMQTYVKRGLQGRYRDVTDHIVSDLRTATGNSSLPLQYEPYYTGLSITTIAGTVASPNEVVHKVSTGGSKETTIDKTTTRSGTQTISSAMEAD